MALRLEVLSPWAEADPVPPRGIRPRLATLDGKRVGLFVNYKRAAPLIQEYVEKELRQRIPGVTVERFVHPTRVGINEDPEGWTRFQEWVRGVDAVIGAVGD